MRDSKHTGRKPRPWSVPKLQGTIGNRAVHQILNPPPIVGTDSPGDFIPEGLSTTKEQLSPEPQFPAEAKQSLAATILMAVAAGAAGAGVGYGLELTRAAPYAGIVIGLVLGVVVLLLWRVRRL